MSQITKQTCLQGVYAAYKKNGSLPFSQHFYSKNFRKQNPEYPSLFMVNKILGYNGWTSVMVELTYYIEAMGETIKTTEEWKKTYGDIV